MYGKGEGTGRFSATLETGLRTAWTARGPIQVELIGGAGAYHLAGGGSCIAMVCGTQLTSGGQFCTKCGKAELSRAQVASSPGLGHGWARPAAATTVFEWGALAAQTSTVLRFSG